MHWRGSHTGTEINTWAVFWRMTAHNRTPVIRWWQNSRKQTLQLFILDYLTGSVSAETPTKRNHNKKKKETEDKKILSGNQKVSWLEAKHWPLLVIVSYRRKNKQLVAPQPLLKRDFEDSFFLLPYTFIFNKLSCHQQKKMEEAGHNMSSFEMMWGRYTQVSTQANSCWFLCF